tara:strand:+ start:285 stop:416 length:132 start_codon:yes stop_codon:yes gene_type:complete
MSSTVEKEKVFAQCHNEWVSDFTGAQNAALEERAKRLLGKTFE